MLATVIGFIAFLVMFAIFVRMVWNAIEIAYRSVMIAVYSVAYVTITCWEAITWVLTLPSRISRWFCRATDRN
jgi:hypothetical protein